MPQKFLTRKTTEHEISNLKQFRNSLGAYVWVLMAFNSIPGSGIFREARNRSNRGKIFFPGAQSSLDESVLTLHSYMFVCPARLRKPFNDLCALCFSTAIQLRDPRKES